MNQKIDAALALATEVSDEQREDSEFLNAGYDGAQKVWQVILRYIGDAEKIREKTQRFVAAEGGFGVAWVSVEQLRVLSVMPEIIYVEKPIELSYEVRDGIGASCISPIYREPYSLSGKGVIVSIIDSGIDLFHPDFRNADGTTRLIALWDQSAENSEINQLGRVYLQEELNEFLQMGSAPFRDLSGHGTHVAGIAAGNGRASNGLYRGVAWEADILVVKLGRGEDRRPQTAELLLAIDFCCRFARDRNQPLALNISYGTSYGAHNGQSLLEEYIDEIALNGRFAICVGAGNEADLGRHKSLQLGTYEKVELIVSQGEKSVGIYLYGYVQDEFELQLESPSGQQVIIPATAKGKIQWNMGSTQILAYGMEPTPYEPRKTMLIELVAMQETEYVSSGIWTISFIPVEIKYGKIDLWLPSGAAISRSTFFLQPTLERTITIPGYARKVITVGAYDAKTKTYASFSGRGFGEGKPDVTAPGVDVISCGNTGGYTSRTGTSMACPFVTGAAALLMQWGIVEGNSPYLYGEKIKAALLGGAARLSTYEEYPNDRTGWGELCVKAALELSGN